VSDDVTWLDYDELARLFGIERESARRLVMRKRWARSKGNDGKARVGVPTDALPPVTPTSTGERPVHGACDVTGEAGERDEIHVTGQPENPIPDDVAPHATPGPATPPVPAHVTNVLVRHVERLEAEIAELRTRAADRDTIAIQVEALRAVLDEVREDRDRWHKAATRAPEPVPSRSWWRRLAG